MSNIRWGCIQPLTGGMYIGARNAIGCDAQWIISYPGLCDCKINKEGDIVSAGNEYSLLTWLDKQGVAVPYFKFSHGMFDDPAEPIILTEDKPDLENIDLVVAVPVCSGLSQATIASQDTKDTRNNNMTFITKYALSVVKPKVYIFENAPALYSDKGSDMRELLTTIGKENGYSVIFYKTDTQLHDNCQKRPRTFVVFVKGETAPMYGYEQIRTSIDEFLSRMPKDATQNVALTLKENDQAYFDFIVHHYGPNWRDKVRNWMLYDIIDDNLWDEFYSFVDNGPYSDDCRKKVHHMFEHIQAKLADGKNYYAILPTKPDVCVQAAMFKSIPSLLHNHEDRLFTIREWLTFMGMPYDFELAGDITKEYAKIGQNVPVRTAQFIVSEAVKIIENWDNFERTDKSVIMQDNTKSK